MTWMEGAWDLGKSLVSTVWDGAGDAMDTIGNAASGHQVKGPVGQDPANYMYGHDPNAANAAAGHATATGANASQVALNAQNQGMQVGQTGASLLNQRTGDAQHFNARANPQGDFTSQTQSLGQMGATGQQLGGLEAQQGPSAAQAQLQAGTNQAMGSQLAMARSGRGFGGNAAAMGQAQSNMAGIQANNATSSAALRAQEDAAWRSRQAANLGAQAGIQGNVAGMQGQQTQTNLGAAIQGQAQNDAMTMGMTGMGQDAYFKGQGMQQGSYGLATQGLQTDIAAQNTANQIRGTEMTGGMGQEQNRLETWKAQNQLQNDANKITNDRNGAVIGAVGSTVGSLAAASDIRGKTDIVPTSAPAHDFARAGSMVDVRQPDTAALDAVRHAPGYSYRYKDPSAPGAEAGPHYGPMAQDLASTPAGATTVHKGPDGKLAIDTGRLALVNTSAIQTQQQQLDEIQKQIAAFGAQPGAAYPVASQSPYPSRGSF